LFAGKCPVMLDITSLVHLGDDRFIVGINEVIWNLLSIIVTTDGESTV